MTRKQPFKSEMLKFNTDLKLEKIDPPISELSTEDINTYLRKQIFVLTKQNEKLQKDLTESIDINKKSSEKIAKLSTKIKEYEADRSEFVDPAQYAASKLVELTKKLREKNVELESLRTKYTQSKQELNDFKKRADEESELKTNEPDDLKQVPKSKDDFKKLQDKLQHTHSRLMEEKNANLKLKNDLKIANKLLQQEVGDTFDNLSSYTSKQGWKGRAQIITELTVKNNELKEKLKTNQGKPACNVIKTEEKDKKVELLTQEIERLKNNLEDVKKKLTLANGRGKSLSSEVEVLKNKIKELKQSKQEDQETINKLTVASLKECKQTALERKEQTIKKLEDEKMALQAEITRQQCIVENKASEIEEKNIEIESLQRKIRGSRPPSSYGKRPDSASDNKLQAAEAEKAKLLELIEVQNERLQEERNQTEKLESVLRYERQRGAKLEANLARLELDQPKPAYSSRIENKVSLEYYKDQLELAQETIRALNNRLEIESFERKKDQHEFFKIIQSRV